jgi:predicted RNA binding protein YcfA (HicA-like mRNA interferase family)
MIARKANPCRWIPTMATILQANVGDVIKMVEKDGWFVVRTKGSHRQFKHNTKKGLVTIAGKPSAELAPGTLNSVLRQAGLK